MTLHVRNLARARRRRRHIPTFGRFCPKKIFCRKLSEMMFKVIGRSCKGLETLKDDFLRVLWCYDVPFKSGGEEG